MKWFNSLPLSPSLYSHSQLARRCHARARPGRGRFRRDPRGNDALVPGHVSPEAAQGWPLPEDVHPGPDGQARSRRRRVHPGAARVVRDLEEAVCGKCWSRAGHVRQIDDCMLIRSGRRWVFRFIFFFRFLQEREEYKFTSLRKVMLGLLESRRELLSATLTQDQTYDLQMKVISKIDWGNR